MPNFNSGVFFQVATANCGNDVLGVTACKQLVTLAHDSGILIINCQELRFKPAMKQLRETIQAMNFELELKSSRLRQTKTKPMEFLPFVPDSGMVTLVLYDTKKLKDVFFDGPSQEAKSSNANKGATINKLVVQFKKNGVIFTIKTVCGHFESNKAEQRKDELIKVRSLLCPDVNNWDQLSEVVTDFLVSGFDANTRSLVSRDTTTGEIIVTNPYHELKTHGHIAPFVFGAFGDQKYSAPDTYKHKVVRGVIQEKQPQEDTSRPGQATSGSLDFVIVQNNLTAFCLPERIADKKYQDAPINIPVESETQRDHNIIVSSPEELQALAGTRDFTLIKNFICKQISAFDPRTAEELSWLADSEVNQKTLLQAYQTYLKPEGLINQFIRQIDYKDPEVAPPVTSNLFYIQTGVRTPLKAPDETISSMFSGPR